MIRYYGFFIGVFSVAFALLILGCAVSPPNSQNGPDLAFSATPTWAPTTPTVNQSITVTCPVINQGQTDAGTSTWSVQRDGVAFTSGTLQAVAAGAATNFGFTFQESATGTHSYVVTLNANNNFTESDTSNNTATITITIGGPDILAVGSMNITPSQPTTATPLTLAIQVTSADTVNTYPNVPWRIMRDGVDGWTSGTIVSLSSTAPASISVPLPADTVVGFHTYTFTVDPDHTITDPVLSNNAASQTINVIQSVGN